MVLGPDGGQLAVKGTTMSTEVSVEHVVPASALVEGNHTVRLEVRDDVGNVAVPMETIVMVVEPVGVFGDVNLSQPTPSSFGVSWDVHPTNRLPTSRCRSTAPPFTKRPSKRGPAT